MTTSTLQLGTPSSSSTSASAPRPTRRVRWRALRELVSGALILAIWLSLWSWVTFGVAAPLGRITAEDARAHVVRLAETGA